MRTKFIDEFSKEVFEQTYQYGQENIDEAHERISKALASVEKDQDYWKEKFQETLSEFKFVPGGRIISNMGIGLKGTTAINCFTPGNQVLTSNGYRDIVDINIGDLVFTHKGRWRRVVNTMKREISEELDVYKSKYLTSDIIVTKEHPFYHGQNQWKDSRDTEHLVLLKSYNESNTIKLDLLNHIQTLPEGTELKFDDDFVWTETKREFHNNAVSTNKSLKINRWIELNENLAYIFGRFVGDGSVYKQNDRYKQDGFNIVFNKESEYDVLLDIKSDLEGIFGIDFNINGQTNDNFVYIRKCNHILSGFFAKNFGVGCENKTIPDFIWESGDSIKKSFIMGVFDADGTITKSQELRLVLKNKKLIENLQALSYSVGLLPRKKENEYCSLGWNPNINSYILENTKKKYKDERVTVKEKQYNGVKFPISVGEDNILTEYVKTNVFYDGFVYNISVEEDESYVVNNVVVHNCFVDGFTGTDQDSMEGILDALRRQALILKSEGGYGFCADVMRPRGGFIEGIGNSTPGSVKMLDMWDTQSAVITEGSGKKNTQKKSKKKIRKGAQMVTMSCWHPDVVEFIKAKKTSGRLTKFNMSVLITDDFMDAVKNNKPWSLEFPDFDSDVSVDQSVPWYSPSMKKIYEQEWDGNIRKWKEKELPTKIYHTFEDANDLWDIIMESTYNRNEPGVLFVDTINKFNNLWYNEYISATNPCGEQILPVGGVCLLGSLNLTQFVDGDNWDYKKLSTVIPLAVRMMDNVNDITYVPLEVQRENLKNKRRIGLGVMGYGSALMMMRVKYGSKKGLELTESLMNFIMNTAYKSSTQLAEEKGSFPLFDVDKYLQGKFIKNLETEVIDSIKKYGIRNSHLLSIQPTGNSSVFANNVSGGLEPVFMPEYIRTAIQPYPSDGMILPNHIDWDKKEFECDEYPKEETRVGKKWHWVKEGDENMISCKWDGDVWKLDKSRGLLKEAVVKDYSVRYLEGINKWNPNGKWVSDINKLSIEDHTNTMSVFAKYIDSAMSKTINIPNDFTYDQFKSVYEKLYDTGVVKGGTTYRAGTMATVLKSKNEDTIDPTTGRNGKIIKNAAPLRPKTLECDIHHITAIGKQWVVLVGLLHDEPYEAFAFKKEQIQLSPKFDKGRLVKIKRGYYNLEIPDVITLEDITSLFAKDEYEAITRLISTGLRHGADPLFIYEQLNKSEGTIQAFSKAIGRTLKRYIKRPPTDTKCPDCGDPEGLIFSEGCVKCKSCGFGEC